MSSPQPRIIAYAPEGQGGVAIVAATGRAGSLGVLVPGRSHIPQRYSECLKKLDRSPGRPFAIRLVPEQLTQGWLDLGLANLRTVIVLDSPGIDWSSLRSILREANRTAWAEVFTRESAILAAEAGFDGLIVAGHEAGGTIGEDTSFILLQAVLERVEIPVFVRGGIGSHVAAGCLAAGASGVVLDGALLLAKESPLDPSIRERIARWDGTETQVVGRSADSSLRFHNPPGSSAGSQLRSALVGSTEAWRDALGRLVGWADNQVWPVGPDASFASELARKHKTTGGIIQAVEQAIDRGLSESRSIRPLAEGSALTRSIGTRFPIFQGPMTRVSDVVAFASAVADGGALPFLALAMLRGSEVTSLLQDAGKTLGSRPWGVGVLGFIDPELRAEQLAAILEVRPPFALIAGGRPDQARDLELAGIATYLHAPSPGLLKQFLQDGSRRFVLEGRECGGHVGPRSSFVLWEQAISILLESIDSGIRADELEIVFAGGIHDRRSASLVEAMASPLAAKGVKIGVLIGTAYLFTREAVATKAIVERFQNEAIRCERTVLLETGPGHEVRVSPSPFVEDFEAERRRLVASGSSHEMIRKSLEKLNAGRLRLAAKGVDRSQGAGSTLIDVSESEQFTRGTYMVGQVATLRDRVTTIAELHASIAGSDPVKLEDESQNQPDQVQPSDIAIIGMSAIMPGARDIQTFWEHTLQGFDAITEIPADRWDWRLYYDSDPKVPDKIVSKWGGFLPDVPFDPLRYGMPPASLPSIEPVQLLLLEATRTAIEDAGYADRPFARERTAVVLGMGGGAAQLAMGYAFRSYLPMLDTVKPGAGSEALSACEGLLPEWTEDSFPGFLLNVAAGRVANRFDLGGANYTVDAACGSSLAAASLAVRELETGSADVVILGGADTVQNPFTYLAFSKTQAFSPRGRCRPFDASADGIVISEGVAVVVLKRLADAERDGDRIYAVIKGIGASSDGRAKGLTAPSTDGQVRAVKRAYAKAKVDLRTVGYVEAHGTGTAVGDVVEVNAISGVFRESGVQPRSVAIGSVKSMIGHTKCAAGLAGLINASLSLYHKILTPTIGVENLNPKADFVDGPFHVNLKSRPWIQGDSREARRAGVSAFGFGGTNFHAVLEAYEGNYESTAPVRDWPAELFAWRGRNKSKLIQSIQTIENAWKEGASPSLRDLARAVNAANSPQADRSPTLAIVANSLEDLAAKLTNARSAIQAGQSRIDDPRGIFYEETPKHHGEPVAFLFPGQGSQYPEMLAELTMAFPEVLEAFDDFDDALLRDGRPTIGRYVYPSDSQLLKKEENAQALRSTEIAQPAIGAASVGLHRLLTNLGVSPAFVAGHSFGELVALHVANAISLEDLAILSNERGRLILESLGDNPGTMAAISAGSIEVDQLIDGLDGVTAVNLNGPRQTVIAGPVDGVERAIKIAIKQGHRAQLLAVAGAFHTSQVESAVRPLTREANRRIGASPVLPVFSNLDASIHPSDPEAISERIGRHVASPVRFGPMIEAMHDAGARVFVEVGPGSVLTPLVSSILEGRSHVAVSCDVGGRAGLPTLLQALARLIVAGVPVRLERLSSGRSTGPLDLEKLLVGQGQSPTTTSTWLVNGSRVRQVGQVEPRRLGQGPALPFSGKEIDVASPEPYRNGSTNGHLSGPIDGATSVKPMNSPQPVNSIKTPIISSSNNSDDRVLASFQETMRAFLDVQRSTMLAYLSGRNTPAQMPIPGPSTPPSPIPDALVGRMTTSSDRLVPPRASVVSSNSTPATDLVTSSPVISATESINRDAIASRLVEIVRDRTGYPSEMLGLELDLEADLGIDSIKRVEILGTLRDSIPSLKSTSDASAMESLSKAKTLGAIVDRVVEIVDPKNSGTKKIDKKLINEPNPIATNLPVNPVRRMILEVVEAPLSKKHEGLRPGGVIVITDDGRGVARAIAKRFEEDRHPIVIAGLEDVDFSSPSSVEGLLDLARSSGDITAIVHALPLSQTSVPGLDSTAWASRIGPEVKGLFHLAKGAADDLQRASRSGGSALIAATAMGGTYANISSATDFFPGQGGIVGLVKTLAREWPDVRTRVVDFDRNVSVDVIGSRLVNEIRSDCGWSEVGYSNERRIRIQAKPASLVVSATSRIELKSGEPVIITGGARGITATLTAELARQWRPTLLLVGRSPLPNAEEDRDTSSIVSSSELKSAILSRLRRQGRPVSANDVEQAFQTIIQAREIRNNLDIFRSLGATVEYAAVNVRDFEAMSQVLDRWRRRFGEPVGFIHGAGVIKDKLIRDKTTEQFDFVLGTKIDGALNLARLLKPDAIRFAAFFSSIAGRFGNLGQTDYAAANEILNKLAMWLDRRWPGRVVAMNWGPWSGVGMVSELERHLGGRGLGMIPPEVGRSLLFNELRYGRKGEVEVIAAGDLGTLERPMMRSSLEEIAR